MLVDSHVKQFPWRFTPVPTNMLREANYELGR
jgi:hypothetical protein